VKATQHKELDDLPLFFIVGRGRSGSTLLRSLFDAHSGVMIPLESRFVQFLYYNYPADKKWSVETALRAVDELEQGFEPLHINRLQLQQQIESNATDLSFERVCKLIYLNTQSEFKKEGISILGDKNPRYTFFIPQLLKLFPGAKFIHLLRDYRDNIVSVQRAGKLIQESGNTYYSMGRWLLYNRFAFKYQEKYPDQFTRVHFEDLIRDPETVMKQLCSFLDLDYQPEVLQYYKGMDRYFSDGGFNALHQSLQTPFDLSKIGEWESELPRRKAIRCEVLGGGFPGTIGYPPEFSVNLPRRICIKLVFYPLMLLGQIRFFLKILFYRWRLVMRMAYGLLIKVK
jgi:hypothetical protein